MEEEEPWTYGTQVLEDGQEIHFKLRSLWGKTNYLPDRTLSSIPMVEKRTLDGKIVLVPLPGYIE